MVATEAQRSEPPATRVSYTSLRLGRPKIGPSETETADCPNNKDSTALYLLAMELAETHGFAFQPVFADTGNEHDLTLDYVRDLPRRTGGPAIRWIKADFATDFARKRRFVAEQWQLHGVPADQVSRALAMLQPTGVPFLDLCLLKGRFPSRRAQFCTEELKTRPFVEQVVMPLLDDGRRVLSWQGVRAAESLNRARLPRFQHRGSGYSLSHIK